MNKRVLLVDENDDEIEFEVSATFGLDEREYAVLFPEIGRASCRERV